MYCISMKNSHLDKIKKLNYIPVGLGIDLFDSQWTRDNTGTNISHKNKFYGTNTFYKEVLSLPVYYKLKDKEVIKISNEIKKFININFN